MNMTGGNDNRLKRYEGEIIPPSFEFLSAEAKTEFIQKIVESDAELARVMREKIGKSKIAEHDLEVAINTIAMLQDERKVFSHTTKGETGSGTYELRVRGGDTKFIGSIALAVIAIVAVAIVLMKLMQ